MSNPLIFPSPDKEHNTVFTQLGENQSGSSYYALSIEKFPNSFVNRIFGRVCLWSPESRFLSVQEWKETDEANPPKLYLLLILDILAGRECLIASVDGARGNILPEGFIGESLMYTVIYYGQFGTTKSFESRFQYLDGWQTIK